MNAAQQPEPSVSGVPTPDVASVLDRAAERIALTKEQDPFARITVIAPSHPSGRDAYAGLVRRLGARGGVVNLHVGTLPDLAREFFVTSAGSGERQELSPAVRLAAVQRLLVQDPGAFDYAADQPVTAQALAAAGARLAALQHLPTPDEDHGLEALTREVLRVDRAVREALAPEWYDAAETLRHAVEHVTTFHATLGLTLFLSPLPTEGEGSTRLATVPAAEARLREALLRDGATCLGVHPAPLASRVEGPEAEVEIVSVSDPDDEARLATRAVVRALDAGVPAHRIGVYWPDPHPYAEHVLRQLHSAGITVSSPAALALDADPLVRSFLTLASLDHEQPDLRALLAVRAQGTLHWSAPTGSDPLPSSRALERRYVGYLPGRAEEAEDAANAEEATTAPGAPFPPAFLVRLADVLARLASARTWKDASDAALVLAAEFLTPPRPFAAADGPGVPAPAPPLVFEALYSILRGLAGLDGLAPDPTSEAVAAAVRSAAEGQRLRLGHLGTGVSLGSHRDAVGCELKLLIMLGLAEGTAPARVREDPLLPDSAKEGALGGELPTVAERIHAQGAVFDTALASASAVLLTVPRGSLRAGGETQPSRWLRGLAPGTEVPSWRAGLLAGAPWEDLAPVNAQEWRVRRTLAPAEDRPDAERPDPAFDSAKQLRASRAEGTFDRFHGRVDPALAAALSDRAFSATALEGFVASPFVFFAERLLGVRLLEHPELELEADRATVGTMIHAALEAYIHALEEDPEAGLETLLDAAETVFDDGAQPQWIPRLWEQEKEQMRATLSTWYEREHERLLGWPRHSAEAAFGTPDSEEPPVRVDLPDGSHVLLSGKVDRIDWSETSARVIDYKSGSATKYKDITDQDPTAHGTRFQLPMYGLYALQRARREAEAAGTDGAAGAALDSVTAAYDFLGPDESSITSITVTDGTRALFAEELGRIMGAIRGGIFPPKVDEPSGFGAPWPSLSDLFGPQGPAHERWQRVAASPGMAPFRGLWFPDEAEASTEEDA